ncbi:MAG: hypothetical protein ACFB11_02950 [Paracoccaceae bacterium]
MTKSPRSGAELSTDYPCAMAWVRRSQHRGMKIGFVTGTDPRQMALIFKMLELELDPNVFH